MMSNEEFDRGYIEGWCDCERFIAEELHLEEALERARENKR